MSKSKSLTNVAMFNGAWLCCVLGGNEIAIATALTVVMLHLRFTADDWREILLVVQVVVLGFFVDSMLIRSGVIVLPNDLVIPPVWLICLWIVFSTLLNHSLRWLHSHLYLAVLLGALAAPFSYYAGIRLTDVSLAEPRAWSLGLIAFAWAVAFPMCLWLAQRAAERFNESI